MWAPWQKPEDGSEPLFHCFRPFVGPPLALPAALVSPVFGAFIEAAEAPLDSLESCEAESEVLERLLEFMPEPLPSENERQGNFNAALARFLGCTIAQLRVTAGSSAAADGGVKHNVRGIGDVPLLIVEVKNEIGPSGDPYFQLQREYQTLWDEPRLRTAVQLAASARPALLLEVVGPCLRVSAAASLAPGRVLCEPLAPFLHFLHVRDQPRYMTRLLATLRALRAAVCSLRDYYDDVAAGDAAIKGARAPFAAMLAGAAQAGRRAMPYPLRDDVGKGRFTAAAMLFQERLLWRAVERGRGGGGAGTPVCVKFSRHEYGTDVHQTWAAAGLAPKLYECSLLPGGLRMVVMELLRKEDGWRMLYELPDAERHAARAAALAVLDTAHALQLPDGRRGVHGDCRPANTLVRAAPAAPGGWEVKWIDFDSAGAEGDKRYPPLMSHQLPWPPGARPGELMAQAHDQQFLREAEK